MQAADLVHTLGLPGIVLGAVLEGEAAAFLGGILAHRHVFSFEAAALAATLGAVLTDNIAFQIGRHSHRAEWVKRLLALGTLARFRGMLEGHPVKAILALRFLYGLKLAGTLLVATTNVSWAKFAVLNAISCLVWAHAVTAVGYLAGRAIEAAIGELHLGRHVVLGLIVFLAAAALLWYLVDRRWASGGKDE